MTQTSRLQPVARILFFACAIAIAVSASSQTVRDVTHEAQVTYVQSPLSAKLEWKAPSSGQQTGLNIFRRDWSDLKTGSYGQPGYALLPGTTTSSLSFTDTSIQAGKLYEYNVLSVSSMTKTSNFPVGFNVPWREKRGGVLILVDQTFVTPLSLELSILAQDLALDGYEVTQLSTPRMQTNPDTTGTAIGAARLAEIVAVRNKIDQWYRANPASNQHVIIVGRVPVPYIGSSGADAHPDHQGAQSSDAYYADINTTSNTLPLWTDTGNYPVAGILPRSQNISADGKLDQNRVPSSQVELQVGRIDFSRLSYASELDLYRRYFARNHAYRNRSGLFQTILPRFLINDNFGVYSSGESFARVAWEGAATIFNTSAAFAATNWFAPGLHAPFFLSYGCGIGSFTSSSGVGMSYDFQTRPSSSPFTALFGSYFGDWDYDDGLLPTVVAGSANSLALTTIWANRDNIDLSPLAAGASIGAVAARKSNHSNTGSLLGDPTLRLQYFAPPQTINVTRNATAVSVNWTASPSEDVVGYHVLRAESATGPFTRLTGVAVSPSRPHGDAINTLSFTDSSAAHVSAGVYAVLAIGRINSGTAIYFDSSQPIFATVAIAIPSAPVAPDQLRIKQN